MSSGEINNIRILSTENMISKFGLNNSSAQWVKMNSILIALAGQGKTRGRVAISEIPLTTNQSLAAIELNDEFYPEFINQNLDKRYEELRKESTGEGTRGGLNKKIISELNIPSCTLDEQFRIGNILKSLDQSYTLHQREPCF